MPLPSSRRRGGLAKVGPSLLGQGRQVLRALRDNVSIGLLCLVLAVAVWVVFTAEQNVPFTAVFAGSIEVEPVNSPPDLQVSSNPQPVQVRLSAPQDVW